MAEAAAAGKLPAAEATSADAGDQKKALDKDGDGKISPEEMAEAAAAGKLPPKEVAKMDLDGDGKLSPEELDKGASDAEMKAAAAAPKEKMKKAMKGKFKSPKEAMKTMDADGDGKISKEEMEKGLQDQGISPRDADKMVKDLDKDGDGKVSDEEMYAATGPPDEFSKSPGEPGYEAPKEPEETPVSLEEFKNRLGQAYKNGKDAWDKIVTPGAKVMTPEQFLKTAADLGVPPGEAKKLLKQVDLNGDGSIDEAEWQEVIGVSPDEVQDRFVDEFSSSSEALKTADADGDGKVSEAELKDVMEKKLGLNPAAAEKAAKEMMGKLDPSGTGKISGDAFKDATKAKADDVADRIEKQLGSAADAMKKWDKDGDGKLTEAEFEAGAAELGISPDAAKDMWKAQDKDGDGKMSTDDFSRAFGIGPDAVMEHCFQTFGNPSKAFVAMDANQDGLLSPDEWKIGAAKMGIPTPDIDRIFKEMDSNHGESTPKHLSKWEFFQYMDYEEPLFVSRGDGFGEIDPFGTAHKEFNKLPHTPKAAVATEPEAPAQAFVHSQRMPLMKWQEDRARADPKATAQGVKKFLRDTAKAKEAPVEGQFMSPKEIKKHHKDAVHRHPLTEHVKKLKGGKKSHKK